MSKYRYLIEASGNASLPFHTTTVDEEGNPLGAGSDYATLEEAKSRCEDVAQSGDPENWGERVALKWKQPPKAWQPDAILVSQYLTEMYERYRP